MPCFDEPSFKSVFQVKIKVLRERHIAISNTTATVKLNDDGSRWFEFEDTPYMSTYLLALIVGKFDTYQT